MAALSARRRRCAIYTRKSSEEGLDQDFNSLDAQREACEAYIKSQAGEGWRLIRTRYDDGGHSGGTMQRPALEQLLADIEHQKVDTIVVYKVDRLTRSLTDFSKIVEVMDGHEVTFVSITQQFNTTSSMGRLTLNMLLSFAQFEREVTGERIRDKIAASKRKGLWMGGPVPLGYESDGRTLKVVEGEAETVRTVFRLYLELGNVRRVKEEADRLGLKSKKRCSDDQRIRGGRPLSRGYIYHLLSNPHYIGRIPHKGESYEGQHPSIVDFTTWQSAQVRLAAQAPDRPRSNSSSGRSPLQGKLFDEIGRPMTPSHTVKSGKRYRYYVSRAPTSGSTSSSDETPPAKCRLPAGEIERLVTNEVAALVSNTKSLVQATRDAGLGEAATSDLVTRAACWTGDRLALVLKVDLNKHEIAIALDFGPIIGEPTPLIRHIVPAAIKPRGVERKIVVVSERHRVDSPRVDPALLKAVARARLWFDELASGRVHSLAEIAEAEGINESYVGQIIPLAFLAPTIVEKIATGTQPADLTAMNLTKRLRIPLDWTSQPGALGVD